MTATKGSETSVTTYAYDLNDRLISETTGGVTVTYAYDANGNMTGNSAGIAQAFDLLNRMASWTDGAVTALYGYNPDNMRRSKTVGGAVTEHVWVGGDIALDVTSGGTISYIAGIKSGYGWHVYNAHGDVVQLADDDGEIVRWYDYDPYGVQMQDADPTDNNPYRYSGQYHDTESGYVYLRARYYDPAIGRFVSEDPAFDGYNWYAYCANNPVMYVDPSGMFWDTLFDIGSVIWSTIELIKEPSWENAGLLALDVASAVVPFVPAMGATIRVADKAIDAGKAIGKADNAADIIKVGSIVDNASDIAKIGAKSGIIEQHHLLPRQFMERFSGLGLDIEKYKSPIDKVDHRLKPDGLHIGSNSWNKQWGDFFTEYPNADKDQVLSQLDRMKELFGLK
jgi:RHS repeat-associated protein